MTIVHNGSTFTNGGTNNPGPYYMVGDDVIGHGTYTVGAKTGLDFLYGGVGSGQEIVLSNVHHPSGVPGATFSGVYGAAALLINHPASFHGEVDLTFRAAPAGAPPNEQSSIGLAMATIGKVVDSYSYKNDMLKLWGNNQVVDTLRLDVHDPYGITVQGAPGGWVFISANTPTKHGMDFLGIGLHPPGMPVHGNG